MDRIFSGKFGESIYLSAYVKQLDSYKIPYFRVILSQLFWFLLPWAGEKMGLRFWLRSRGCTVAPTRKICSKCLAILAQLKKAYKKFVVFTASKVIWRSTEFHVLIHILVSLQNDNSCYNVFSGFCYFEHSTLEVLCDGCVVAVDWCRCWTWIQSPTSRGSHSSSKYTRMRYMPRIDSTRPLKRPVHIYMYHCRCHCCVCITCEWVSE